MFKIQKSSKVRRLWQVLVLERYTKSECRGFIGKMGEELKGSQFDKELRPEVRVLRAERLVAAERTR